VKAMAVSTRSMARVTMEKGFFADDDMRATQGAGRPLSNRNLASNKRAGS
jgi:hypothetical protein